MIVIGVDTHKRSHTLVALDAATGGVRGQLKIAATDDGTLQALRFAAELADGLLDLSESVAAALDMLTDHSRAPGSDRAHTTEPSVDQ